MLKSLTGIVADCDPMMFKKITFGLGGVVPLLQYIQGRKYEQLAELCGEVDETGVVPLRLLRNKQMMSAIGAVVGLIKVRSSSGFSRYAWQVPQWCWQRRQQRVCSHAPPTNTSRSLRVRNLWLARQTWAGCRVDFAPATCELGLSPSCTLSKAKRALMSALSKMSFDGSQTEGAQRASSKYG